MDSGQSCEPEEFGRQPRCLDPHCLDLPFVRSGQNHLARHSERGEKTRQTEEEEEEEEEGGGEGGGVEEEPITLESSTTFE